MTAAMPYHTQHPDLWRVDHAIEALRKMKWLDLAATIETARRRARPAPSTRRTDGYPTSTLAGRGSSELTSVEAAADANLFGKTTPQSDSLHHHVTTALALLTETAGTAAQLQGQVELIKALLGEDTSEKRACDLCGATDRPLRFGTVAGRLPTDRALCEVGPDNTKGCWKVVYDNGAWPSTEQVDRYKRTGRWRYHITPGH